MPVHLNYPTRINWPPKQDHTTDRQSVKINRTFWLAQRIGKSHPQVLEICYRPLRPNEIHQPIRMSRLEHFYNFVLLKLIRIVILKLFRQDPELTAEELETFYREKIAEINKNHEDTVRMLKFRLKRFEMRNNNADDDFIVSLLDDIFIVISPIRYCYILHDFRTKF